MQQRFAEASYWVVQKFRSMARSRNQAVNSEEDLKNDAKRQQHARKQRLLNALTTVSQIAIFIIPLVLAGFYFAILGHKIWIGDWAATEESITQIGAVVLAYFFGTLSRTGLLPNGNGYSEEL